MGVILEVSLPTEREPFLHRPQMRQPPEQKEGQLSGCLRMGAEVKRQFKVSNAVRAVSVHWRVQVFDW
jgi:hypothetical protein